MRKLFKYVLPMALVLALLLVACTPSTPAAQPTPEPTAAATATPVPVGAAPAGDGTYETTGQGMGGPITVSTTIAGGKITAVEVLSHTETAGISTPALERIPQTIVDNNSVGIDAVTGATMTSNGILAAVKAAIVEAGLNESDFSGAVVQTVEDQNLTADVLIIGAGGSGLAAANVLVREGKDVLIIEKMAMAGGATAVSGGGFIGATSKLQQERGVEGDSVDALVADLIKGGQDNYEPLTRLFAENNGATIDWMYYDLKLAFRDTPPGASPEHQFARSFGMEGGASGITSELLRVYEEAGGKIMYETKATSLTVENGAVVGAVAEGVGGSKVTITAANVLLATGGYGNNDDLLPDSVANVLYYGPDCSTGDGLLMAQEAGAMTWYMDHVKVYPQGIETAPGKAKVATGCSRVATRDAGAIYVDREGNRLLNENLPFTDFRNITMELPDQVAYIFMDQAAFAIWREASPNLLPIADIDKYVAQNGGTPMFANAATIEEVAAIAGVDAAGLQATVDKFNGFVAAGKDEDFGRAELFEIGAGPYYLIEQKLRFASTLGGLKINDSMQVLNEAEEPIAGLYASGEIVGGVHGKDSMPSCNVGWALTSGRLAGLSLAEK